MNMQLCYCNYSFNQYNKVQGLYYYRFWYYGNFIDLKCKEKLIRGDVMNITSVSESEIIVSKVTQPLTSKIPVLIFAVSRIPLSMFSDYEFSCTENDRILFCSKNIKDKCTSYFIAFLSINDRSKIYGKDNLTGTKVEFLIEE